MKGQPLRLAHGQVLPHSELARPNGVPSESRQITQRSRGWTISHRQAPARARPRRQGRRPGNRGGRSDPPAPGRARAARTRSPRARPASRALPRAGGRRESSRAAPPRTVVRRSGLSAGSSIRNRGGNAHTVPTASSLTWRRRCPISSRLHRGRGALRISSSRRSRAREPPVPGSAGRLRNSPELGTGGGQRAPETIGETGETHPWPASSQRSANGCGSEAERSLNRDERGVTRADDPAQRLGSMRLVLHLDSFRGAGAEPERAVPAALSTGLTACLTSCRPCRPCRRTCRRRP